MEKKCNSRNILLGREWFAKGTWYAPQRYLEKTYPSVIKAEYYDTMNSSGDWEGFFIQKIGVTYYLILFRQENNGDGFRFFSSDGWSFKGRSLEAILDAFKRFLSQYGKVGIR